MVYFYLGHDEVLPLLTDSRESERLYLSGSVGIHSTKAIQPVLLIALIYGESDKPRFTRILIFLTIKNSKFLFWLLNINEVQKRLNILFLFLTGLRRIAGLMQD